MKFSDGDEEFVTYDGLPVSRDRPHGAAVVVLSNSPDGWRYLILHRAHNGPDFEGDWAWTPPTGARLPGEDINVCASRELLEEAGLRDVPEPVAVEDVDWAVFRLVVPWGTEVAVDGIEHDRYEWVSLDEACSRCLPVVVADSFRLAPPDSPACGLGSIMELWGGGDESGISGSGCPDMEPSSTAWIAGKTLR